MSYLKTLIRSADYIKKFESYFEKLPIDRHTPHSLKIHQSEIERLWSNFRTCYGKTLDKIDDSQEKSEVQLVEACYFATFESYLRGLARINELLDTSHQKTKRNYNIDNNKTIADQTAHISVPPCDTEIFHGDYKSWPTFRDTFTALYRENQRLSSIEKMCHLLKKTQGEARDLLKTRPITNDSFEMAWQILVNRYEDKGVPVSTQPRGSVADTRPTFSNQHSSSYNYPPTAKGPNSYNINILNDKSSNCLLCSLTHPLRLCPTFLKMTIEERYATVKHLKRCTNCLGTYHDIKRCKSRSVCNNCQKRHHSLLHLPASLASSHNPHSTSLNPPCVASPLNQGITSRSDNPPNFSTTPLTQTYTTDRILRTFSTQLQANTQTYRLQMRSPIDNQIRLQTGAFLIRQLTGQLSHYPLPSLRDNSFAHLQMADKDRNACSEIELPLGGDVYPKSIRDGFEWDQNKLLVAQRTVFGWIVTGRIETVNNSEIYQSFFNEIVLSKQIQQFWKLENIPLKRQSSPEDAYCAKLYETTTLKNSKGRFIGSPSYKHEPPESLNVSASRHIAIYQSHRNENKPSNNQLLKAEYDRVITEYATLGQMTKVNPPYNKVHTYYSTHHAVTKPDNTTTKLYVVLNAFSPSTTRHNNILYPGPVLQADLTILLRWRFFQYIYNDDTENIYRQILITFNQLSSNNLWWHGPPWLKRPHNEWSSTTSTYVTKEKAEVLHSYITQIKNYDTLQNFSYPTKALRVVAQIIRFFNRLKQKPPFNKINETEISTYDLMFVKNRSIIKYQQYYFNPLYYHLSEKQPIARKSHLIPFSLFIDSDGTPFSPLLYLSYANYWQRLKILYQNLAERWKEDYLKELRKRTRWKYPHNNFEINDMMVVKPENLPPNQWQIGRIPKVHPGSDKRVRVVDVRTSSGVITRPRTKLVFIPPLFNIMTITHPSVYLITANKCRIFNIKKIHFQRNNQGQQDPTNVIRQKTPRH